MPRFDAFLRSFDLPALTLCVTLAGCLLFPEPATAVSFAVAAALYAYDRHGLKRQSERDSKLAELESRVSAFEALDLAAVRSDLKRVLNRG